MQITSIKTKADSYQRHNSNAALLKNLRSFGNLVARCPDIEVATQETRQTIEIAKLTGNRYEESAALYKIALCYLKQTEPQLAFDAFQDSMALWAALEEEHAIALVLEDIFSCFLQWGTEEEGLPFNQRALEIYRAVGDKSGEAAALNNLSLVYKKTGDAALSQEMLHLCLAHQEATRNNANIAFTSLNIANNYNILEESEQAITFAARGVQLLEELGRQEHLAMAIGILGTAYVKKGDLTAALAQFERALLVSTEYTLSWVINLGDLGDILIHLNRFSEACAYLHRAVDFYEQEERVGQTHRSGFAEALGRLGVLYSNPLFDDHDDKCALCFLLRAAKLGEEGDTAILLVSIYESLMQIYERLGDNRLALAYSHKLRQMERRLFNDKSDQRIRLLQVRFEVEKTRKDAEITHLRSVELAGALAETERLRSLAETSARTDALTGVSNRRYLEERLLEEVERSRQYDRPLSIALLDVDHFKRINDMLGHAIGDIVLKQIAILLQSCCREGSGDHVARYGGEEFVMVLPETDTEEVYRHCEQLRLAVSSADWLDCAPGLEQVTISIGLVTNKTIDHSLPSLSPPKLMHQILKLADDNLYSAKREGRNRVVLGSA